MKSTIKELIIRALITAVCLISLTILGLITKIFWNMFMIGFNFIK